MVGLWYRFVCPSSHRCGPIPWSPPIAWPWLIYLCASALICLCLVSVPLYSHSPHKIPCIYFFTFAQIKFILRCTSVLMVKWLLAAGTGLCASSSQPQMRVASHKRTDFHTPWALGTSPRGQRSTVGQQTEAREMGCPRLTYSTQG